METRWFALVWLVVLCVLAAATSGCSAPVECCQLPPTGDSGDAGTAGAAPRVAVKKEPPTCDGRGFQDLAGNAPACADEGATCAFDEAQEQVALSSQLVFYEFACQEGRWNGWRTVRP